MTSADSNSGAGGPDGEASVANLQSKSEVLGVETSKLTSSAFLNDFVCQANANGTEYFL
jgi:glucan 1,3-beta-glucosidase